MADALEMTIRHAKECEELYNISGDAVIEAAESILQQFKDGGKEVAGRTCQDCGTYFVSNERCPECNPLG